MSVPRIATAKPPLHSAVKANAREMVELLLAHGADPNAKDNRGETPLHSAAKRNDREMVEILVFLGGGFKRAE